MATSDNGLSRTEAQRRIARESANEILEGHRRSLPRMFLVQFADFMILVLLAAALIAGIIGEPHTIAILVIVLLNAVTGTFQEYR